MIYTGYFGKYEEYLKAGLTAYSIARYTPTWWQGRTVGRELKELAPSEELLQGYKKGKISMTEYRLAYLNQLEHVKWQKILKLFDELNDELILLCYETPYKFCHRHILAEYLRDNDIEIWEWNTTKGGIVYGVSS